MGRDAHARLQPVRRKILFGIGASAVALSALRVAHGAPPDRSGVRARLTESSPPPAPADAVLYEEDPANSIGLRFPGTAAWRADMVPGQNGAASETIVRAHIAVPERGLALEARFARNTDKSLPATHTIELQFTLPANFVHGGIDKVPGLLMKPSETARGAPLAGLSIKVTTLYFMVGLAADEKDRTMNMTLLRERNWFDVPMVYADQRRAILAFAKGPEGERAFGAAFAAWGGPAPAAGQHEE